MARERISIGEATQAALRALGAVVPPVDDALTTEQFFAFWRRLAEADPRPELGLRLGAAMAGRSVSAQAALQAPTLGAALQALARYKRLSCPEEVLVELADDEPSVRFDWVLAAGGVPPLLIDAIFAANVALVLRGSDGKAAPARIELTRKRRHAELLRAHFGCPIVFGATHDRIVFAPGALATPFVTANRAAYAQLLPGLEARLVAERTLLGDVRQAIARTISAGARPSIESVAERLQTSARTLQRRLGQERTTFQEQLDDVRRLAARRLLEHTELPPIDIAFLLGFAEPNSFARAFRGWERTTPLRWRAARG